MWVLDSGEQARERAEIMLQVSRSGSLKVQRTEAKLFVLTGPDCCSGLASEEQWLRRKQPLLKAWSWL